MFKPRVLITAFSQALLWLPVGPEDGRWLRFWPQRWKHRIGNGALTSLIDNVRRAGF
jgi:hypothetical protein